MAHYKRRKPRTSIRCSMCTQHRWKGNSRSKREGRHKAKEYLAEDAARAETLANG